MIKNFYRLLETPFVYRFSQFLLTPGLNHLMGPLFKRVFGASRGKILDVGCGPTLNTPQPKGLLVGVDINGSYIRQYTGGFIDRDLKRVIKRRSSRRRLGFVASAENLPFRSGIFNEARSYGLFHHLPDEMAHRAMKEMKRCVRKGGRVVILDAVWPVSAWTRPVAWAIRKMDRGKYVRYQEQMLALLQKACPGPWAWERMTGTYTGLEYLAAWCPRK